MLGNHNPGTLGPAAAGAVTTRAQRDKCSLRGEQRKMDSCREAASFSQKLSPARSDLTVGAKDKIP